MRSVFTQQVKPNEGRKASILSKLHNIGDKRSTEVFRLNAAGLFVKYQTMTALIVFSTFPDESRAREAAGKLIEEQLAACITILPGLTSLYRWKEKIETSSEVLLMIKTTHEGYPRLESALKACHPYELPEILAVAADAGLPEYIQWVGQETINN